jgi:hypothetical protein
MRDFESLAHVRWDRKYHAVFIPKYRRKVLYGKLRAGVVQCPGPNGAFPTSNAPPSGRGRLLAGALRVLKARQIESELSSEGPHRHGQTFGFSSISIHDTSTDDPRCLRGLGPDMG